MQNPQIKPTHSKIRKPDKPKLGFLPVSKLKKVFSPEVCVMGILSVMISMSPPVLNASPFGAAFFAAAFNGQMSYIYFPFVLLGAAIGGASITELGKYIFAMACFALIYEKIPSTLQKGALGRAVAFSVSLFFSGLFFKLGTSAILGTTLLYDFLLLFLETLAALGSVAAFSRALPLIRNYKLRHSPNSDEVFSLVFLCAIALRGLSLIPPIGQVSVSNLLCIVMIMVFSLCYGATAGATAGITMGIIAGLGAGRIDTSAAAYAFCGLASGFFGRLGPIAVVASFILANGAITAFTNGSTEVLINIFDILGAGFVFLLIPSRFISQLSGFASQDGERNALGKFREKTASILKMRAETLMKMEKTVLCDSPEENAEIKTFFERTARRACQDCAIKNHCWNKEVRATYAKLLKMLESCEKYGKVNPELLPSYCLRPDALKSAFEHMFDVYRADIEWSQRVEELQKAAAQRMEAAAHIIKNTAEKISEDVFYDVPLGENIDLRLRRQGIWVESVCCTRDSEGIVEVSLSFKSCGGFSLCELQARDIVSDACGIPMQRTGGKNCAGRETCFITYRPVCPYKISVAAAGVAKTGTQVSGDFFAARNIGGDTFALALCDGMGSGPEAARASRTAANLLLDLLENGFSAEEALGLINSVLLSNSSESALVALDLCLFNMRSGEARLLKSGGAAAFSRLKGETRVICSPVLPSGSGEKNEVKSFSFKSGQGDVVVLLSDGMLQPGEEPVKDIINQCAKKRPSQAAELIISGVRKILGEEIKDDLTAIVALVEKNQGINV